MNLDVAVRAGASENSLRVSGTRKDVGARILSAGVPGRLVALLAQERLSNFQHRRNVRSVRIVTVGTVILRRSMLPEEGAALLGVALVAGLVDRGLLQRGTGI